MVTVFNGFRVTFCGTRQWCGYPVRPFIRAKALDCPDNIIPIFQPPHLLNSIRLSDFGSFSKVNSVGKLPNSCTTAAEVGWCANSNYTWTASLTSTSSLKPYLAQLHKELVLCHLQAQPRRFALGKLTLKRRNSPGFLVHTLANATGIFAKGHIQQGRFGGSRRHSACNYFQYSSGRITGCVAGHPQTTEVEAHLRRRYSITGEYSWPGWHLSAPPTDSDDVTVAIAWLTPPTPVGFQFGDVPLLLSDGSCTQFLASSWLQPA